MRPSIPYALAALVSYGVRFVDAKLTYSHAMTAAYQRNASRVEALLDSTTAPGDRDAALRRLARSTSKNAPADAPAAWPRDATTVRGAWKQAWQRLPVGN